MEKHLYEAQAWQQRSQAEKATTKVGNLESDGILGHEQTVRVAVQWQEAVLDWNVEDPKEQGQLHI